MVIVFFYKKYCYNYRSPAHSQPKSTPILKSKPYQIIGNQLFKKPIRIKI
jgi:hypothetical protein